MVMRCGCWKATNAAISAIFSVYHKRTFNNLRTNFDAKIPRTRIRLTRSEFHQKVRAAPIKKVAQELGLSAYTLANLCRKHNIPLALLDFKEPVPKARQSQLNSIIEQYSLATPQIRERLRVNTTHIDVYILGSGPEVRCYQYSLTAVRRGSQKFGARSMISFCRLSHLATG